MAECLNCGRPLKHETSKYCSNTCQLAYERNKYIEDWKNGLESGSRGKFGISTRVRKYLLDKYDNKCQICGWGEKNPFTNMIPLEIHHIDGNHKNNKEENLQVLCPNCHSLTETYKKHNKHSTRTER